MRVHPPRLTPGRTYSFFLVKEFLKTLFVCVIFIMGLSYIVRTLQKTGSDKSYTIFQTVYLHLLDGPGILLREALLPSCMFAAVYTMSTLSKNREILALRACGVSGYRIITPLIVVGLAISAFAVVSEDRLLIRSIEAKEGYLSRLRGEGLVSFTRDRTNVIVFGENETIFKIDTYLHKTMEMRGVAILQRDGGGNVVVFANAAAAVWNGRQWILRDGVLYRFGKTGALLERKAFTKYATGMKDDPKYFARDTRKIQNMHLKEGWEYITMSRKMGLPYKRLIVKYHRRIAQSVTLLFVIVIGLSLGSMAFKNALVISFSFTLGFVLLLLFTIEIGDTFGNSGVLPPIIGGWLGNIVFFFVSVLFLRRLRV
jgi:lipopolysaccharide export system permease protein